MRPAPRADPERRAGATCLGTDLVGSRSGCPPAEDMSSKRNQEHPKDKRDEPVDRERQQESQHDQDGTYSDEDNGHDVIVCQRGTGA